MSTLTKQIRVPLLRINISVPTAVFCVLCVTVIVAACIGAVPIPLTGLLQNTLTDGQEAVFFSIRLPRVFLAVIVGAALAISGAAMQGLFRNPLADPGLIGISSGAALAVALVIVLMGSLVDTIGLYGLSFAAFLGGLITSYVIFAFAKLTGSVSMTYMLLAGIAINALTGAGTSLLTYLSDDQQLRALTFWTMGSLGGALWETVLIAASIVIPSTYMLIRTSRELNILLLGEEEAQHLGVDSERLKRNIIICVALSVGAAVAVSGIIGFVGLVVPHLIRLTLGPDHRMLIPTSALLGALLLVIADTFARTIVSPAEMPVGILTSLIGGPFFLWLLIKQYAGRI